MVMLSSTLRGRVFKFHSHALGPNTLLVTAFQGQESISHPFRFEVDLVSQKADLDATAILQNPAFLGVKQGVPIRGGKRGVQTLKIHGVLASFEQFGKGMGGWVSYRAVLVPRLWRLSLGKHTRIFQEKKVPEIVEEILKGAGLTGDEYEFRTAARPYPKREYVVQYQESDLNFIARLLEHEGIFYYFEHGDEGTKVVFGDSPAAVVPILGEPNLPYRPMQASAPVPAGDWFDQEKVASLGYRESPIPAEVVLRDYNYRTPSVDLKVAAPVVPEGFGQYYEYGDHYKDQGEGKAYAQVRAEEIKCRQKLFVGQSDCRSFRSGHTYTLADHYRPAFNTAYLLKEVRHKASQAIELTGGASRVSASYANEFESIPAEIVFRPGRVTSKPRIHGTMHARVDAAGDGKYAEIDDQGRYKVQIPFDLSGKDKATATRWIRKAEPYTGPDYGIHFPLHKGAEVILTHIDGDPDRPIIVNAVPNPETGSPVKGENQQQCVIKTGGGNKMVISDGEGGENITLHSPHSGTTLSMGGPGSGALLDTLADMTFKISNNWLKAVTGNSVSQIDGAKQEVVKGHTFSTYVGGKEEHVLGARHEITIGSNSELNLALKSEVTVGGILTLTQAVRVVEEGGWQFSLGPGVTEKHPAKVKKAAAEDATYGALKKKVLTLIEDVGDHNQKIGTLAAIIGKLSQNIGTLDQKVGAMSQDLGKWTLSGGPVIWDVGSIDLTGGTIVLESGGDATVKASSVALRASSIDLDGEATCKKPLKVNGKFTASSQVDLG